jgi:hypothetical protein
MSGKAEGRGMRKTKIHKNVVEVVNNNNIIHTDPQPRPEPADYLDSPARSTNSSKVGEH